MGHSSLKSLRIMKRIKEKTTRGIGNERVVSVPELFYYSDYPAVGFRNDKLLTKSHRICETEISEDIQGLKDKK